MLALNDLLFEPEEAWRESAACAGADIEVFFPDDGDEIGTAAAKAICENCPVQEACLQYALATNQTEGVWGGMDKHERRRMRRRVRDRERRRLAS